MWKPPAWIYLEKFFARYFQDLEVDCKYDRWSGDAANPVGEEEVEAGDQGQLDDLLLLHCQGLLALCLFVSVYFSVSVWSFFVSVDP